MPYTPMMLQYFEVKEQYSDHILFYRLGDFYEMFFEDAKTASRELELTLTGRDCGMEERAPMCGVPYHSAEGYIAKLVSRGYKVAICEQTEDPAQARGIVKREVIRIITPGTVTEGSLLLEGKNNYLCAIYIEGAKAGFAVADISTAEVYATDFSGGDILSKLMGELAVYSPSEIITNLPEQSLEEMTDFIKGRLGAFLSAGNSEAFTGNYENLEKQFGEDYKEKYNIVDDSPVNNALCALIDYLIDTQKGDISHINKLTYYTNEQFLALDVNTRRNLELCEAMRTREKKGTLLWVLDKTKTAMGSRLLRKWVEQPLLSVNLITQRQNAVKELYSSFITKEELQLELSGINDIERLLTKIVYGTAGGRDLTALMTTCEHLPKIRELLSSFSCDELCSLYTEIDELSDICSLIKSAICENPPFSVREGGFIRDGYNAQVDELRGMLGEGKSWISQIEAKEKEATGIKNLKIGYNRVFGYYIEVTKSYIDMVPETYIRKQTLTGCERYITQELKDMEAKVLGAQDKVIALEYELFVKICTYISENMLRIQKTAALLARLDAYVSLADVALKNNYVCPEVDYSDKLEIRGGRHPIVEKYMHGTQMFVPNDAYLDENRRIMLITGPNMAGKSTYMRQNALIVIMAQIGSFVPCESARIGIVDKVFTRVGASDDLASGQSTFMLEMNEVAYILANATKKSFIIYDEIGRGTSTYDGMSIARAICEYTAGKKIGAKTMFATHYHELCELPETYPCIVNYSIAAKKRGDELIFLRKIVEGAADDSYGIEVAKLAGVPNEVIKRAKEVLESLEGGLGIPLGKGGSKVTEDTTLSFEDLAKDKLYSLIKHTDLDTLSPIEALQKLYELKKYTN